jgi:hypothetical protein
MENLRQINDINYTPIQGDNVKLNERIGFLLDENFNQIQWLDNNEIENWFGGWQSFVEAGGFVLVI